ncbi:MAG TPA: SDR family NAD(P)-dependent oxidoreductase [Jiangellales bacterium]|nr:SDR family NAD(P)-dependent oxidoreductase [Jiangellales bacterium]
MTTRLPDGAGRPVIGGVVPSPRTIAPALTGPLAGRSALVAGASQGIGSAVAEALARAGARVVLVARRPGPLVEAADRCGIAGHVLTADLAEPTAPRRVVEELRRRGERIDLLVYSAGEYLRGAWADTPAGALDYQLALTARAPYELVQRLLPDLRGGGDVVLLVSTVRPAAGLGAYAAAHAALRSLARTLRAEVSGMDLRVLEVRPGRTATPRQRRVFEEEGRLDGYHPELLLQPEDVASVVLSCVQLPRRAEVTEVELRPSVRSY